MGEASHKEKRPTCLEGSLRYPLGLTALDKTYINRPIVSLRPISVSPINL